MKMVCLPSRLVIGLALAGAFAVPSVQAFICDNNYHFQSAYERILVGSSVSGMKDSSTKLLNKNLDITTLNPASEYKMVTDFTGEGACNEWKRTTVDFAYRRKGDAAIGTKRELTNYIKLNSGDYPFAVLPTKMEYWFGLAVKLDSGSQSVSEIIGKMENTQRPHVWYGMATMRKDYIKRNVGTVDSSLTSGFPELNNHPDSGKLQELLTSSWKNEVNNDTQRVAIKVQLIKVVFDSISSPVTVKTPNKGKSSNGFQVNQVGNVVFIRPSEKNGQVTKSLALFDMMGRKVAALHPTGYLFQWNGKTSTGADSPTGVYFVQFGSRILGKFFYTR